MRRLHALISYGALCVLCGIGAGFKSQGHQAKVVYVADFYDDLMVWFIGNRSLNLDTMVASPNPYAAPFKNYFTRLKLQGVDRLVVFQEPWPFLTTDADAKSYCLRVNSRSDPTENIGIDDCELIWNQQMDQAKAIAEDTRISSTPWRQQQSLLKFRIRASQLKLAKGVDPSIEFSKAATEAGIALEPEIRPFEGSVSKFFDIPTFDGDTGQFLWEFHPFASPELNYHPELFGLPHIRQLFKSGNSSPYEVSKIVVPPLSDPGWSRHRDSFVDTFHRTAGSNLTIIATKFPPQQPDGLVLVRRSGKFQLDFYRTIQAKVESNPVSCYHVAPDATSVSTDGVGALTISGLESVPTEYAYIQLSGTTQDGLPVGLSTRCGVVSSSGRSLDDRISSYWAFTDSSHNATDSLATGIALDGAAAKALNTPFYAEQNSLARTRGSGFVDVSKDSILVIDRGQLYSDQAIDISKPLGSRYLANQAIDLAKALGSTRVFVNTRSHMELPGEIDQQKMSNRSLAYTYDSDVARTGDPLDGARDELSGSPSRGARNHGWRDTRSKTTASGMVAFINELRKRFNDAPGAGDKVVQVLVPESPDTSDGLRDESTAAKYPGFVAYNNYSFAIAEGLGRLTATDFPPNLKVPVEPVFTGVDTRGIVVNDRSPNFNQPRVEDYVNHGQKDVLSRFGLTSSPIFFEVSDASRTPSLIPGRDWLAKKLLASSDVNEVFFYESQAILYGNPDFSKL